MFSAVTAPFVVDAQAAALDKLQPSHDRTSHTVVDIYEGNDHTHDVSSERSMDYVVPPLVHEGQAPHSSGAHDIRSSPQHESMLTVPQDYKRQRLQQPEQAECLHEQPETASVEADHATAAGIYWPAIGIIHVIIIHIISSYPTRKAQQGISSGLVRARHAMPR